MKTMLVSARLFLLACGCIGLTLGCSGGPKLPPLVSVTGKVTVAGQPATGGNVGLLPVDKGTLPEGVVASGPIDGTGNYKIMTNGKDGAPVGQYKVTVSPPMTPGMGGNMREIMELYKRYSSAKDTPLHIDVKENGGPYDLDIKKE
jgi:hypothetical protein